MIESIQLKNIKSIETLNIDTARITLFIGPNNSGKSTLLQTLMVLKQSWNQNELIMNGRIITLGSISNLIRKNSDGIMKIYLSGNIAPNINEISQLTNKENVLNQLKIMKYCFELEHDVSSLLSLKQSFMPVLDVDNFIIRGEWNNIDEAQRIKSHIDEDLYEGYTNNKIGNMIIYQIRGDSEQIRNYTILQRLGRLFRKQIDIIYFVPAYRGLLKPSYPLGPQISSDFVSNMAETQNLNVTTTMAYRRGLENIISYYVEQVTNTKVRTSIQPDKQVVIESVKEGFGLPIIFEGFGTNQLIQLFLTIAASPNESTILIEEPEIHLHPKAQSNLAEVLNNISKEKNIQLILTTHSEHILFKLLALVKRGIIDKSDLVIYHFELKKGITKVDKLEIDEKGMVRGGLKSFFDVSIEQFGEFFKIN